MVAEIVSTGVSELDLLFSQRHGDGGSVTTGALRLTPVDARELLWHTTWRGQGRLSRRQLMMLVDSFRNGECVGHSLLSFGLLPSGGPVMVDGQHRLEASIAAGWEGDWLVRLDWDLPAREMYALIDSYQTRRGVRVQGAAFGDDELEPPDAGAGDGGGPVAASVEPGLPAAGDGCVEPPVRDVRCPDEGDYPAAGAGAGLGPGWREASSKVYRKLMLGGVLACGRW